MQIEKIEEYAIDSITHLKIQNLLQQSFEQYPSDRIFYQQVPNFRLLAWDDSQLIAQVGVVFRIVGLDKQPFRILGVMDLCVDKTHQNQRIGTKILKKIEAIGIESNIDFILLFGGKQDFYLQNGFKIVENKCRWVMMKNYETLGVMRRQIPETLLVKALSNKVWNEKATLDLMGFVF